MYASACVSLVAAVRNLQIFVKAREERIGHESQMAAQFEGSFGQGLGNPQPKFLEGGIWRQAGRGWYEGGGQLELSVSSASQGQVFLKET